MNVVATSSPSMDYQHSQLSSHNSSLSASPLMIGGGAQNTSLSASPLMIGGVRTPPGLFHPPPLDHQPASSRLATSTLTVMAAPANSTVGQLSHASLWASTAYKGPAEPMVANAVKPLDMTPDTITALLKRHTHPLEPNPSTHATLFDTEATNSAALLRRRPNAIWKPPAPAP